MNVILEAKLVRATLVDMLRQAGHAAVEAVIQEVLRRHEAGEEKGPAPSAFALLIEPGSVRAVRFVVTLESGACEVQRAPGQTLQ